MKRVIKMILISWFITILCACGKKEVILEKADTEKTTELDEEAKDALVDAGEEGEGKGKGFLEGVGKKKEDSGQDSIKKENCKLQIVTSRDWK